METQYDNPQSVPIHSFSNADAHKNVWGIHT